MRDVGILVWVGLLLVGVIGSMISSLRRQTQSAQRPQRVVIRGQAPGQLRPWLEMVGVGASPEPIAGPPRPPPAPPRVPARPHRPAAAQAGPPPELHAPEPHRTDTRRRLFANKRDLVAAVIAAEVLGKPRALRDEYFWNL
jgi:hypothetical protein